MLCILLTYFANAQDTLVTQTFESNPGAWGYSATPEPYNISDDIWDTVYQLGELVPFYGNYFWGMQDLDNNNGGGSDYHILDFMEISLSGYVNNTFSVWYNAFGFDSGDKLQIELLQNGVVQQIEVLTGASGGISTEGWECFSYPIPDSVISFQASLMAKQNGGTDQAGWDYVMITGFPEGSLPLTANFSSDKTFAFCNDSIHFSDDSFGGSPPYSYAWDFDNDGSTDDTTCGPFFCYSNTGTYSPKLTISDCNGDSAIKILENYISISTLPNAWINEIHYDDNSKDTNEGVEVVIQNLSAHTLNEFIVSLYNGNNGEVYSSANLSEFIAGDTIGDNYFYHLFFSSLQNGSPDGIALSYYGKLLSFISYEGSFIAIDGPASGVQSSDILVHETSSTPVGTSIQCSGSGDCLEHFFWQSGAGETFGHSNNNQYFLWPDSTIWSGQTDSCWLTDTNWSNGIPGPSTNILLDTGSNEYPCLSHNVWIHSLTMNDGAFLYDTTPYLHCDGLITVKKLVTGGTITDDPENAVYHFLGSPVKKATAINSFPPEAYVRRYSEQSQSWENLAGNDTLLPGEGYSVYLPNGDDYAIFSDSSKNSDVCFSNLSLSGETSNYHGFHLLSNPFLSPIDWDFIHKENIAQTVYVWYNGDYIEWNGFVGNLTDGIIPVAQGFFVQVIDNENQIHITSDASVPGTGCILKEKEIDALEVALYFNDREDNCFIAFDEDATTGFDPQYDALKLQGQDQHPAIYFHNNAIRFAISFNPFDSAAEYPMGIKAPEDGNYTLCFFGDKFLNSNSMYLKDHLTGIIYDLKTIHQINFQANEGDDPNRFELLQTNVGVCEATTQKPEIIQSGQQLSIQVTEAMSMKVFSVDGKFIHQYNLHRGDNKIHLGKGFFMLQFPDFTKKVIIL
jgi:hypothetical protein